MVPASGQDKSPDPKPAQQPTLPSPSALPDPMAPFARLVGGEWKMTAASGTSMYDTWHWGPGRHSLRAMTHGEAADHSPWRELRVLYWHPGRKQVCLLGVGPFQRSVWEGTMKFDGETAEALADLHQSGPRHRRMRVRWTFDGPDTYHEELLEATGAKGFEHLAAWDRFRSRPAAPTPVQPNPATNLAAPPVPSEFLKALEPLLGHTWGAAGIPELEWAAGPDLRSTVEWIPYADYLYVRVAAPVKDAEPAHVLDAYIYHHTETGKLRCLALSSRGGVYEGDIAVRGGGALEIDLKGYEGDRVVPYAVRFSFVKGGDLSQRVWSVKDSERTLLFELRHKRAE